MAKIANVFGRLEAFSISILLYIVGYVQMAGSNNVQTFASAQIFYSAGSVVFCVLSSLSCIRDVKLVSEARKAF